MKSIKTGFVVVVMLAVAYGVWVMLNKKPVAGQLGTIGQTQWAPPELVFPGDVQPTTGAPVGPGTFTPPDVQPPQTGAMPPVAPNVVAPSDGGGASPYGAEAGGAPVLTPEEYERQQAAAANGGDAARSSVFSGGNQLQPPAANYEETSGYEPTQPTEATSESSADRASDALGASAFLNAWRGAQDQIAQGELAGALFTLSLWYDSPDVPADMQTQLVELLDQLAGHVIYSPAHLLEPAHEVRSGESLEEIASQYEVPWQLLANINGIADPAQLQAGTQLKVIRGPFHATISLDRKELLLTVGRRYAGRFAIGLGNDPAPLVGEYIVREKEEQRTYYDREYRAIEPGAPENPYGPYWIGLGGLLAIHGAPADANAPRESTGSIIVSPEDAADLFAILSKDSPVVIRR